MIPLLVFFLLRGVESGPFFLPLLRVRAGEAKALSSLLPLPLAAEEAKCLPLPPAATKPLPLPLDAREAEPLAGPLPARGDEPPPLPSGEARALALRAERQCGAVLVLLVLGVLLLALGVEPGVGTGPGDDPKKSGECVVRFGRSATAVAAGDPFRALASGRALAGAFVLVLLVSMLEGVSRGDGRNAEESEKTDRARKDEDGHGGDNSGRGGGGAAENAFVF